MTWPWEMLYYLLIFTSFRLVLASTVEEIVTLTPTGDVSVPRNDTDFTTFVCKTNLAAIIRWLINGISSADDSVRNRGVTTTTTMESNDSSIFLSTLSIPTTISNDNTIILCQAIVTDGDEQVFNSTPVLLRVEDRPGPPLQTDILPSSGTGKEVLMWNEPATVRVLHFKVCVNVTADSLKCYNNVSGTNFTFPNVGVNLLFTVSAVNVAGEGPNSSALHRACQGMQQ